MSPEVGHFALILALCLALVQAGAGLAGAARRDFIWMRMASSAACAQAGLVALSFLALTIAYMSSDFSLLNVWQNSHSAKPLLYKLTGVWGNHEGSMLLWVFILSIFGAAVAAFGANLAPTLKARVVGIQGVMGLLFLLFILMTSNPFVRLDPTPLNGQGLNPILQDPGLAFHPPFLYLGYVGFSVTFAFAIAALMEGRVDAAWARWVRPWTLAAWSALTVGIALGSYWAYYELGWGGWWFWDPVENASLMPWLAGTALLHSAIVTEKRGVLKSWTVLLAILAFSLSLLGTFLVRSGILTSVHAFANDPQRGMFVLIILMLTVGGSLVLYALRAPTLKPESTFAPLSREGALIVNNLFLAVATLTVFIGTLYPLVLDTLNGSKISVGPPYFNLTFGPLMAALLFLVPFGPMLPWKRADLFAASQRLIVAAGIAFVGMIVALAYTSDGPYLAVFGFALGVWLIAGALSELAVRTRILSGDWRRGLVRLTQLPRSAYGSFLGHAGLGVLVLGITAMSSHRSESIAALKPGDAMEVAGYSFIFEGVKAVSGPNYQAIEGSIRVVKGNRDITILRPQRRTYPVAQQTTTEAGIHTGIFGDLYAVLGEPQGQAAADGWAVRVYRNPLVIYIWIGSIIMAVGGCVSLSDRRLRVGVPAPRRRAKSQTAVAPAE